MGKKQIHRGAEEWNAIIKEWESSGKTIRAWSEEKGLSCESLRRWRKRFGQAATKNHFIQVRQFLPVSLPRIRVLLRDSVEIELCGDPSEELLQRVVHVAIEEAHVS